MFGDVESKVSGAVAVLQRESYTLHDLLDQDDVLQEAGASQQLVEYLLVPSTFASLLDLVLMTDADVDLKYPFVACQLLCLQGPIGNAFFASEEPLRRLFDFLARPPPLPPLSTEYCCRVLVRLVQSHYAQLQARLVQTPDVLLYVCRNVGRPGCAALLSALFDAACTLEPDTLAPPSPDGVQRSVKRLNADFASWLLALHAVEELMGALVPGPDLDSPANAVATLQLLLNYLDPASPLLSAFCCAASRGHIAAAVGCYTSAHPSFRSGVDMVVKIICSNRFEKEVIAELVVDVWNAAEPFVVTLQNTDRASVGQDRYELVQLCTALALIGNPIVVSRVAALGVPSMVVDLLFRYPRSNMFQATCTHFFSCAFMVPLLQEKVLTDEVAGRLIRHVVVALDLWPRVPERGFLLQFCGSLIALRSSNEGVNAFLRECDDWTMHLEESICQELELQRKYLCDAIPDASQRVAGPEFSANVQRLWFRAQPEAPVLNADELLKDDGVLPEKEVQDALSREQAADAGAVAPISTGVAEASAQPLDTGENSGSNVETGEFTGFDEPEFGAFVASTSSPIRPMCLPSLQLLLHRHQLLRSPFSELSTTLRRRRLLSFLILLRRLLLKMVVPPSPRRSLSSLLLLLGRLHFMSRLPLLVNLRRVLSSLLLRRTSPSLFLSLCLLRKNLLSSLPLLLRLHLRTLPTATWQSTATT